MLSSSERGRLREQAVAKGAMHQVELYSYSSSSSSAKWTVWDDFPVDSNLMILDGDMLASTGNIVPINDAHKQGLLHRGIWLAVLRNTNDHHHEILLLRRAASLKTCPNVWGLCGEHSDPGEAWVDTARRAIDEELRIKVSKPAVVNLLPNQSVLVRTVYVESGRLEMQATGILTITLTQEQAKRIQPDDEVAEFKWVPLKEFETIRACNDDITSVTRFVGQRLKHLGYT